MPTKQRSRDAQVDGKSTDDGGLSQRLLKKARTTRDHANNAANSSSDGVADARDYERAKFADSQANKKVDNGRSSDESDENISEKEDITQVLTTREGDIAEVATNSDLSGSSSKSSSEDEESCEEEEESEKRPDDSTAFGRAFQKIMKRKLQSTALTEAMGLMLSAHKKLVAEKLEEVAEGQKAKKESKKEKQALREKGHTVPASFPTAKDKELLKLATRGVVKLLNAVSKAQSVQVAAVSKDSEAKDVAKRSKSTFLAMLQGGNGAVSQSVSMQKHTSNSTEEADGQPGWSALQETFMLGKSRLKDWDKKRDDPAESKRPESSGDDSDSSE